MVVGLLVLEMGGEVVVCFNHHSNNSKYLPLGNLHTHKHTNNSLMEVVVVVMEAPAHYASRGAVAGR